MDYVLMSGSFKNMEIYQEIINFLNRKKLNNKNISFIAASFYEYNFNDYFVNKLIKLFGEKKFVFNKIYIIDNRLSNKKMIDKLNDSEIIFLLGGDTLNQIKSINKNRLKNHILNKMVIGMSAGAINMAKKVVLAKDINDNIPELSIYNGIGLTNINIEPHCDFKNKEHWKELEKASNISDIIVMNDDCFIISDKDKISFYGSYIKLSNKKIYWNNKICTLETFLKGINYD